MENAAAMVDQLVRQMYGFEPTLIEELAGYDNLNYKIKTSDDQQFVFKINEGDGQKQFEAESRILNLLAQKYPGKFQNAVPTKDGQDSFLFEGKTCRMLSWLDGDFLANEDHSALLLSSFGSLMAHMDKTLLEIDDTVIKARRIEWDVQHVLELKPKLKSITDPEVRKLVDYYLLQFKEAVLPELPNLRKCIIHNDANDWNILVNQGAVSGIIDFGDVVYAPLIQEVAVALTYVMTEKKLPLESALPFLTIYHKILPLEVKEIDLLYYFIAGRVCLSLIQSFDAIQQGTADDYTLISQKPIISLLKQWIAISPEKASNDFKNALGFEVPAKTDYEVELKRRHLHIGRVLSVSYQQPIKMKRAAFQYMFDADGNTYLDAYNNIPHVGHQHPRVVEAGLRQMAMLNTNTRYIYDQLASYAEKLLAKFPEPLNKVFFVNSGSEASDLAIRIAHNFTNNSRVAVLEHGYHGNTRMGINISHYKFGGKGGRGPKNFITTLPLPDEYRGAQQNGDRSVGEAYAHEAVSMLDKTGDPLAAFIAEPIVGCGGQVPLAEGYLKALYPEIRKRGGLCISDEVQTGFGRMGSHFWGFEMHGVVPDMVVLGKPMGNGHPMGAVVTTDEIADAFNNGMEFFSSFGGNPVSCAIGMAVLDVIEEEQLQQNALKTGNYFMDELRKLQKEFRQIGDVRGSGLFIGIDLVTDPQSREPNTQLAQYLKNKLRESFILVSTDGPYDNVIKMKPPLCFGKGDVAQVLEAIKKLFV
ncbi:MAG TPA: aminotransferase class III-fold pyridoxal phosphate-dependent enzyme [Bacteroidales bacterium]|nr:aminotransferase class III-fold pyridoxal phosphate-dependent enzyme [Bacteroidales bacterium]